MKPFLQAQKIFRSLSSRLFAVEGSAVSFGPVSCLPFVALMVGSRDDQSKIWVLQTWSTDYGASVRTLKRNVIATNARAAELEKRLAKP